MRGERAVHIRGGVNFYLTSVDVLHSWALPRLSFKVDAIPGRLRSRSLFVPRGRFFGFCSELCKFYKAQECKFLPN